MYIKFRSLWKFVHVLNELEDKTILAFLIHHKSDILVFFQKEVIFLQLDELDELDRISHAWIRFS